MLSADDDSDILTKNLSTELHEKHARKMVVKKASKLLLVLKTFEVKRKGDRCDVLTLNILRNKVSLTRVSST